tara:strand:+ start:246 stop:446 length:201 start_codon:yes stop_codon:yes gene_type:complete
MANSDKLIVWTEDDGTLSICFPSDNTSLTVEEIQEKDVPSGKTSYIINKTDLPSDRTFRDAWTYTS